MHVSIDACLAPAPGKCLRQLLMSVGILVCRSIHSFKSCPPPGRRARDLQLPVDWDRDGYYALEMIGGRPHVIHRLSKKAAPVPKLMVESATDLTQLRISMNYSELRACLHSQESSSLVPVPCSQVVGLRFSDPGCHSSVPRLADGKAEGPPMKKFKGPAAMLKLCDKAEPDDIWAEDTASMDLGNRAADAAAGSAPGSPAPSSPADSQVASDDDMMGAAVAPKSGGSAPLSQSQIDYEPPLAG
jgi:hypothetical protein